uniref:Uncharacterized protein n=1 Tax=Caenorhabditis japonica TaxID=281687 RepID=A0A8R1IQK8_CAEJA
MIEHRWPTDRNSSSSSSRAHHSHVNASSIRSHSIDASAVNRSPSSAYFAHRHPSTYRQHEYPICGVSPRYPSHFHDREHFQQ